MTNWCNAAYKSLNIEPNGELTPCGIISPMHGRLDNKNSWDLLRAQDTSQCTYCKIQEQLGSYSVRQLMNDRTTSDQVEEVEYLNINLSNVCNLQCHSCDSTRSVLIKNRQTGEYDARSILSMQEIMDLIELHAASLRFISFQGGEPFLWNDFPVLMMWLQDHYPEIKTAVVTNLGRIPNWVLEDQPFSRIKVSLDGIQGVAETTRVGTNWLLLKSNLRKLLKVCTPLVSTTISITNLQGLGDLSNFIQEWGIAEHLDMNVVINPEYLAVANLPQDAKKEFLELDYGLYNLVARNAINMDPWMDPSEVRESLRRFPIHNLDKNCPILAKYY